MPTTHVQPVILCGGSGTRLWPLSRAEFPKQFLSLFGQESLFQMALGRVAQLAHTTIQVDRPIVVGNEEHRFLLLDQMQAVKLDPAAIILEPMGRNTAPALTLAASAALETGQDPVLVVSPADHMVMDVSRFVEALRVAVMAATDGAIVTLGVRPDRPETGYGYIRAGKEKGAQKVEAFVEKPNRATAERYIDEGSYYWNSGIFVLKASVWVKVLTQFRLDMVTAVDAAWKVRQKDASFVRPGMAEFKGVPSDSIDYAVMEKCVDAGIDVRLVPLAAGWSDLGSWDAAWQTADKDAAGNASVGDAMIVDSSNVLVHASSRLVTVMGMRDVVVVETPDAVLVTDRNNSQDVRKIVNDLQTGERGEHTQHRKVYRPWGWYDSIDAGPGFKVKRIMVKPGARLSLQKHHKRAEHWVVVSGVAEVTCGDKVSQLKANQSTYIPLGEVHRLTNPGKLPLEIIEVQSGEYLGEDDIVRLEDHYGRISHAC